MANKKDNLKSLFTNTRSRVIIVFTFIVLILAVTIGYFKIRKEVSNASYSSELGSSPGEIQSIPGVLDPTAQYAKLQEQQNEEQAQKAETSGSSSIPTIIRTQKIGEGVGVIGTQSGVGFSALSREDEAGAQRSLWIQSLQDSSCSKSTIDKVISQGAQLSDLRSACSCTQLKDDGYKLQELDQVCACKDLRAAGFNARQLKDIGYSAGRLRDCGFDACELRNAGYTGQQMKDGGFSDGEMKGAGFSDEEIARAAGLPNGITADDVRKAGCDADSLNKLRQAGVSVFAVRRITGCSVEQLKSAGYTAQQLKDGGFSAADLTKAGFSPEELKTAGYTARDLLNAGYTPAQLANAGFSESQIKAAEAELPPNVSPADVKNMGCTVDELMRERAAGISAASIKQYAGCSPTALKVAGFTDNDLANAGFSAKEISSAGGAVSNDAIKAAGCDPIKLKQLLVAGVSAARIKQLNGCTAQALKEGGYSQAQINAAMNPPSDDAIKAAGCDPAKLKQLLASGASASRIRELNGCSAQALKEAGFSAKELHDAGFSSEQLAGAGFTPAEISAANSQISDDAIKAAGCDPTLLKKLFAEGVSATRIKAINGCSAQALKDAGFSAKSLANAGFSPAQLLNAGFTARQLEASGVNPADIIAAGRNADCSIAYLKKAKEEGLSAAAIKQTLGCSSQSLKAAGFGSKELKDAGFSAAELKDAGFSPADLKAAGFSPKELKDAGLSAADLKAAGYGVKDLKDAGFSAADLKNAGFSAGQLKSAGFSAQDLKNAGFSAKDMKNAGFSAKELKDAGYSAAEATNAGYTDNQLSEAGFTPQNSSVAGLEQPNLPISNSNVAPLPSIQGANANTADELAASNLQLQSILNKQNEQMAEQKYQQKIQQRTSEMQSAAATAMQRWRDVSTQTYTEGNAEKDANPAGAAVVAAGGANNLTSTAAELGTAQAKSTIKTGDIMFAVMDTAVNSDQPGPILATIVSGRLKGAKLIGSFNLPSNSNSMVITFNTLSIPGAPKTMSINAFGIDPNTARTALSSRTDHHYLMRYGSLFASSFLEGFGNAFQSANTTVTIGGTGGGNNITVQNGIGRSTLENAVIGLATVGKSWGQAAQQLFSTPVTVEVYAGTGIGVLFTQDVTIN